MGGVLPTCLALVLCDRIGVVRSTLKPTPVGVFSAVPVRSFPTVTAPFSAWMQFTQGSGQVRLHLLFERLLPDSLDCELLVPVPFMLRFSNPNLIAEHTIEFSTGLALPFEGAYRARLVAGSTTLMTRPFAAIQV